VIGVPAEPAARLVETEHAYVAVVIQACAAATSQGREGSVSVP
jgi:hypothetical protein